MQVQKSTAIDNIQFDKIIRRIHLQRDTMELHNIKIDSVLLDCNSIRILEQAYDAIICTQDKRKILNIFGLEIFPVITDMFFCCVCNKENCIYE